LLASQVREFFDSAAGTVARRARVAESDGVDSRAFDRIRIDVKRRMTFCGKIFSHDQIGHTPSTFSRDIKLSARPLR